MNTAETFQELVLSHLDALYAYARLIARKPDEAEDLLQEALLRGFEHFDGFDVSLSFKPWMFTILKRAYIDRCRRRRTREGTAAAFEAWAALVPVGALHATPVIPDDVLLRRETLEQVRTAIGRLPAPFREVVELRDVAGLSYEQIAAVTRRPVGTVMSRLSRARALLREYLVGPRRSAASTFRHPA
jgi:RNA polymerase sigma-70 factor (ECF subfamily)